MYLYGKEFDLVTDHKPLKAVFKPTSCPLVERWVLRLQSYNFKIKYIQEKNNIPDLDCLLGKLLIYYVNKAIAMSEV